MSRVSVFPDRHLWSCVVRRCASLFVVPCREPCGLIGFRIRIFAHTRRPHTRTMPEPVFWHAIADPHIDIPRPDAATYALDVRTHFYHTASSAGRESKAQPTLGFLYNRSSHLVIAPRSHGRRTGHRLQCRVSVQTPSRHTLATHTAPTRTTVESHRPNTSAIHAELARSHCASLPLSHTLSGRVIAPSGPPDIHAHTTRMNMAWNLSSLPLSVTSPP